WKKTSFRLKFLSRSILNWHTTRGLLSILASNPLLDEILSAQPNLPCKLHRPYLAANMNKSACLSALSDHYDLIIQR
ncbi:MAG: VirK/YbjX family protein, partial [Serratia symbiotica]|nr:VirK/YbjX family protein [Serratia symbiotica]